MRDPWTARRSNQSILKEISPEYSLEGLILKMKLPYFGHLMRRTESLEKTLMLAKVHLVKAMVFPVVMYGCESWTIKKIECQRIDAFEFWCWRRLLRDPWTARRSNQSILKEFSLEYSLKGLMLKLQSFGHLLQRTDSLEKTLMLGKIEVGRRREWTEDEMVGWRHRLNGHEFEQAPGIGDGQGGLACCSPLDRKESDTTERLN